jgi:NAD(P)-dependent dehydrogenase (short-subunit alcohol dehydrogenase family)
MAQYGEGHHASGAAAPGAVLSCGMTRASSSRLRPLAMVVWAGTPLGQSLARALAARGCDLLLCDEEGECLLALREELAGGTVQVQLFQGDMGRPEHRRELLHFLRLAADKPDILCFQAVRHLSERRLGAPPAEVRSLLEANLLALDDLLRGGLLGAMAAEGNGYILAALRDGRNGAGAVDAVAAEGLRAYLAALAEELRDGGVGITVHLLPSGQEHLLARPPLRPSPQEGRRCAEQALGALFARKPVSTPRRRRPRWLGGA